MTNDLNGLAALIVGGTSGIGLATAERLLRDGARAVCLAGRNRDRGEAAGNRLAKLFPEAQVDFIAVDASDGQACERMMEEAFERLEGIDALVSCAGGSVKPRLLHSVAVTDGAEAVAAVSSPVITPAHAGYRLMRTQKRGSIICVASDAAKVATPGEVLIGAGMAAITMFCRGLAIEAKRDGIRVNCITPSIVRDTPLYDALMQDDFSHKLFAKAEALASLGVVAPDEIATLAAFLAGPGSVKLTGQTISVNGGISAA
jgi:2-hydroxycyclohexanecarboxyl-CoA dehydrogenase